jgi:hypothetical protein
MRHLYLPLIALTLSSLPFSHVRSETGYSLGLGANYWQVIDNIEVDNVEENGFSWLIAYRYDGGLLNVQAEVEIFPEEYAGATKDVYSPQALVSIGERLFAGVGVGIQYSNSEWAEKPYYFLRAGFSILHIGPAHLDLHANYIFSDFSALDQSDIDTDTATLGAMIRLDL